MRTQSGRNPLLERLKQVYWPIDGLFEEFSTSFPPLFLASLRVEANATSGRPEGSVKR